MFIVFSSFDNQISPPQVAPAMVVAPPNQVQGVQQIIVQQPQVILASV